jgi:Fe-S-cluster-containing dehydrogenase component
MSPTKPTINEPYEPGLIQIQLKTPIERRGLLLKFASAVFASLVAPNVLGQIAKGGTRANTTLSKFPELPDYKPGEDVLIRMLRELQVALAKPETERRWVMVIDLRKCVGCHACTVACIAENKLPPGVVYRPVIEEEFGVYPNVGRRFIPRPCMQCDNPPCVPVCPVNATWKGEDGIVHIDYEKCIGCRYCLTACPYAARTFDFGEHYSDGTPEHAPYEDVPSYDYGVEWKREGENSPVGNARKCHFCLHRVNQGMLPMCVSSCIGRATYFGDANNPDGLMAELIAHPSVMRLKEDLGTEPRVYYLQ